MLVLSRRVGESIVIGGGIVVRVTKIDGHRVSLAIEAPKDVLIRRTELTLDDDRAASGLESEKH